MQAPWVRPSIQSVEVTSTSRARCAVVSSSTRATGGLPPGAHRRTVAAACATEGRRRRRFRRRRRSSLSRWRRPGGRRVDAARTFPSETGFAPRARARVSPSSPTRETARRSRAAAATMTAPRTTRTHPRRTRATTAVVSWTRRPRRRRRRTRRTSTRRWRWRWTTPSSTTRGTPSIPSALERRRRMGRRPIRQTRDRSRGPRSSRNVVVVQVGGDGARLRGARGRAGHGPH